MESRSVYLKVCAVLGAEAVMRIRTHRQVMHRSERSVWRWTGQWFISAMSWFIDW